LVEIISPPGCSTFPTTDNNYGKLPQSFALDVEIDEFGYDSRFSSLSSLSPVDPGDYVNLWGSLSVSHQDDILVESCYCPGEGVTKPNLTIGQPRFPAITPLPFFWIPNFVIPDFDFTQLTVRTFNPDDPLPENCCTDEEPHIILEIVDGEIQATRREKPKLERIYRTDDVHPTFQAQAGYPRWCCIENDCVTQDCSGSSEGGSGGATEEVASGSSSPDSLCELLPEQDLLDGQPTHVLRYLHFPLWPGRDIRDPYACEPEEPLGLVPVVVDIQCDPATGLLHVYHANLIFHDGKLAELQWDVNEPRPFTSGTPDDFDPALAPQNPEELEINKDYQDKDIYDPDLFFAPIGTKCEDTCNQAIVDMGKVEQACEPDCPSDAIVCEAGETGTSVVGTGDTSVAAQQAALAAAIALTPGGCDPDYIICYCRFDADDNEYETAVKFCCP
jgi:hypothetical protein